MISFILLNLNIYIPFHLFEEAVGDLPEEMEELFQEHMWNKTASQSSKTA